jgi:hypothetical protein
MNIPYTLAAVVCGVIAVAWLRSRQEARRVQRFQRRRAMPELAGVGFQISNRTIELVFDDWPEPWIAELKCDSVEALREEVAAWEAIFTGRTTKVMA